MYNFCFQDFRSDRILDYAKKAQQGQIQLAGGALYGSGAKKPTVRGSFDPYQTPEKWRGISANNAKLNKKRQVKF